MVHKVNSKRERLVVCSHLVKDLLLVYVFKSKQKYSDVIIKSQGSVEATRNIGFYSDSIFQSYYEGNFTNGMMAKFETYHIFLSFIIRTKMIGRNNMYRIY